MTDESRQVLARQLSQVHEELKTNYREVGEVWRAERDAKDRGYWECNENSVAAREHAASRSAHEYTMEALSLQTTITILEEERDHIRFLIDHNIEVKTA